ncbi:MAG TPA: phasin family protein [Geminicoccus sp.]|jgi:phasin family protein|uniref:phasin family protein n=1 Tax=Geminicoccus sp. TaxID=2024832 RepID=UPI002E31E628|nr:phasin family protein [Geminicoccus sp.]HEX2528741.1 phasin family protein [Geminicoccus sp.]
MSEISPPKATKGADKAAPGVEAAVLKTLAAPAEAPKAAADAAQAAAPAATPAATATATAEKAGRPMMDAFDQFTKAQAEFAQKMGFDPKTFAFSPAKFGFDPSKFSFDPAKLGFDPKAFGGNMPKFDLLFAQQQKNMETFFKAQAALVDGVQTVYQRQVTLFQQTMSEATSLMQSLLAERDGKAGMEKQVDASKKAFEKIISEAKELGDVVSKSQGEAFRLLNDRAVEQIEEMKAAYEKAA